jgi:aminomethyltransferase
MEKVLPADVSNLPSGVGTLTSIPNEQGGLIDDCIITNAGDHLFLVINAGHDLIDLPHINNVMSSFSGDVELKTLDGNGILALQGPESAAVLSKVREIRNPTAKPHCEIPFPFLFLTILPTSPSPSSATSI